LKRLEVTVLAEQSTEVEAVLDHESLPHNSSSVEIAGKKCKHYWLLVPDLLVDKIIEVVSEELDLRRRENTIVVMPVEGVVSPHLERLREKAQRENPPSNPLERLVETIEKYVQPDENLMLMVAFASLIAVTGLFLDNVSVVIGAMLLSPLLGPINAFAVNVSLGRIRKALRSQLSILLC
jgi:hypothetical protein